MKSLINSVKRFFVPEQREDEWFMGYMILTDSYQWLLEAYEEMRLENARLKNELEAAMDTQDDIINALQSYLDNQPLF